MKKYLLTWIQSRYSKWNKISNLGMRWTHFCFKNIQREKFWKDTKSMLKWQDCEKVFFFFLPFVCLYFLCLTLKICCFYNQKNKNWGASTKCINFYIFLVLLHFLRRVDAEKYPLEWLKTGITREKNLSQATHQKQS